MELKFGFGTSELAHLQRSNRTFMELKFRKWTAVHVPQQF